MVWWRYNYQGKLILKRGESKLENIITFLKDILNYTATLMPQVIVGLKSTLEIFTLTLALSIPLGIIVALGRLSKIKIINKINYS